MIICFCFVDVILLFFSFFSNKQNTNSTPSFHSASLFVSFSFRFAREDKVD